MVRAPPRPRSPALDAVTSQQERAWPTLDVVGCSRLLDEPVEGVWASDHFGVVADLAVASQPPVADVHGHE